MKHLLLSILTLMLTVLPLRVAAQEAVDAAVDADSVISVDFENKEAQQVVIGENGDSTLLIGDTKVKTKRDWATWTPDPQKALWLALVLPGAGQIYNRKYWKLPIFYGGMIGCVYAMRWNNMMYKDYSQAYLDIMDDDPTTESYNYFLHLGVTVTDSNKSYFQSIFKKRKDRYRRWRDLSFFCLIGVYALSVIDAYVDAELSVFDMSDDLSLKVKPTIINDNNGRRMLEQQAPGVQFALNF